MNPSFTISSADGLKLHGRSWTMGKDIKGIICLIHGLGEHSGRYEHVADFFCAHGFALLALDLRGHGKSDGQRGHAQNYDVLMSDITLLLNEAEHRFPLRPKFLYGHSLGGNLVLHYGLKNNPTLSGVIASAPLLCLSDEPPIWQRYLIKKLQQLNLNIALPNGINPHDLSRTPEVEISYKKDPLTHNRITPTLAIKMMKAAAWNLEHAADFPLPLLLLHGNSDRITAPEASRIFAEKVGKKCTFHLIDKAYHELHNEPNKDAVLNIILEWLNTGISNHESLH